MGGKGREGKQRVLWSPSAPGLVNCLHFTSGSVPPHSAPSWTVQTRCAPMRIASVSCHAASYPVTTACTCDAASPATGSSAGPDRSLAPARARASAGGGPGGSRLVKAGGMAPPRRPSRAAKAGPGGRRCSRRWQRGRTTGGVRDSGP